MILNFKQFLIEAEDRFRDRPESQEGEYATRVQAGRAKESKVVKELMKCNALKSRGYRVEEAGARDDISLGVDAWLIGKSGQKIGVQVKHRESSGDDIAMEMVKSFDSRTGNIIRAGRDAREHAVYFAVANRSGTSIDIVDANDARDYANQVVKDAMNDKKFMQSFSMGRGSNTYRSHFEGERVEVKMATDRETGMPKLLAYVPIGLCQPFVVCDANIK